jgi:hypothetical protein
MGAALRRFACALVGTALLVGISQSGRAQDSRAREFDQLSDPMECTFIMVAANNISESRDKGVSKRQIVEWAKTLQKFEVPKEVIDGIYEFPKLRPLDHAAYWSWQCRARANGIPIAPLKTVEAKLGTCPVQGDPRGACLQRVRNELLGLPVDFVPEKRSISTAIQDVTPPPKPAPAPDR